METLITYGSQYGSTEYYAKKFAEGAGFTVLPYREVKSTGDYDRVIHFGALYAGGVLGLRQIAALLAPDTEFIIVTVGLADVEDAENKRRCFAISAGDREDGEFKAPEARLGCFEMVSSILYCRGMWSTG